MEFNNVNDFNLVYLATPYSKYPKGIEQAFQDASAIAGKLLKSGVKIYSPIAHTHPLAIYGDINPLDHSIWIPFDESMMRVSQALIVAMMDTWQDSYGVNHEIEFFRKAGKPIYFYNVTTGELTFDRYSYDTVAA